MRLIDQWGYLTPVGWLLGLFLLIQGIAGLIGAIEHKYPKEDLKRWELLIPGHRAGKMSMLGFLKFKSWACEPLVKPKPPMDKSKLEKE